MSDGDGYLRPSAKSVGRTDGDGLLSLGPVVGGVVNGNAICGPAFGVGQAASAGKASASTLTPVAQGVGQSASATQAADALAAVGSAEAVGQAAVGSSSADASSSTQPGQGAGSSSPADTYGGSQNDVNVLLAPAVGVGLAAASSAATTETPVVGLPPVPQGGIGFSGYKPPQSANTLAASAAGIGFAPAAEASGSFHRDTEDEELLLLALA